MNRAGWRLGAAIVLVMAAGMWLGLRPYFQRETVHIAVFPAEYPPAPSSDALASGVRCAVDESGGRAGRFRVSLTDVSGDPADTAVPFAAGIVVREGAGSASRIPFLVHALALTSDGTALRLRILPSLETLGTASARWAKRTGASRPVLLRESHDRGISDILTAFREEARRLGLAVPPGEPVHEPIDTIVDEVLQANSDFVFYGGERAPYSRMAQVFAALKKKGYAGRMAMADVDARISMLDAPGPLVEGTYLVSPLAPPPPDFGPRYRAFAGKDPGPHVYYGYLAGRAALDAITAANSKDVLAVEAAATCLPGFDARGETTTRKPALYRVQEGRFEFVEILK